VYRGTQDLAQSISRTLGADLDHQGVVTKKYGNSMGKICGNYEKYVFGVSTDCFFGEIKNIKKPGRNL